MRNVFTSIYNGAGEFINSTLMVDYQNTASREQIPVRGKHSTNIYLPDDPIYETDSANKKYVDNKFDIIDSILSQSNISYQADIVDTYTERITADSENVLDGSKAILKKVEGSTVACRNLFDKNSAIDGYEIIDADGGTLEVNTEWFTTDYIPVRPNTYYVVSGKPNGSVVMAYNSNKEVITNLAGGNDGRFVTTEDTAFVRLNGMLTQKDTFQLEEGTTATEYQPYFTGLKSASFGGIESGGVNLHNVLTDTVGYYIGEVEGALVRNEAYSYSDYIPVVAGQTYVQSGVLTPYRRLYDKNKNPLPWGDLDSRKNPLTIPENVAYIRFSALTEFMQKTQFQMGTVSTEYTPYISPYLFDFPKTETPLGTTIDFENKKIVDYGVDLVLTGTERWSMRGQTFNDVNQFYSLLLDDTKYNFGEGVCTDFDKLSALTNKVGFAIGSMNAALYLSVDKTQITSVDDLNAWLAQRYADGNPVTIRYVSTTLQSETDITTDNEYIAYKGGMETVLDNDGAEYGADNTLTQNYLLIKEVK